jgi:antitoxin FitA
VREKGLSLSPFLRVRAYGAGREADDVIDCIDFTAYNSLPLPKSPSIMATLTIRDLDDTVKQGLRMRAARHSRSMEEEVRQILRQAIEGETLAPPQQDLASRIRARMETIGGVELKIAPRELPREPPDLSGVLQPRKRSRGAA